jgi:serine/threonine protein kinase
MAEAMFSIGEYLAHGASGVVEQREGVVTKRPYSNNASSLEELEIEARIYQHLGPHPRVVRFLSWDHEQSILRTGYMKNGNLKSFINSNQSSTQEKFRWIKQAGDTIQVPHNTRPKALLKLSSRSFCIARG